MGIANADKSAAPRKLDLLGTGEASSRPKWNCVDSRLERIPPKAPAIPMKAGKSTRIASTSSKSFNLFSTTKPAIRSRTTAKPKTGMDWRKILLNLS